jgi:hypothetical protein
MRTTLDIDDDILSAARELARAEGRTIGEIISDLARQALTAPIPGLAETGQVALSKWPTLPSRGGIVTTEIVKRIQEELDMEDGMAWDHATGRERTLDDDTSRRRAVRRRKPAR